MTKKFFSIILIYFLTPLISLAQYQPLVSDGPFKQAAASANLNEFLATLYNFGVGVAVSLSILFIILGGVQYMTTDAVGKKGDGKKRIQAAVAGLLIALSSWLIINQINPKIFETNLGLSSLKATDKTTVILGGGNPPGGNNPPGGSQPGGGQGNPTLPGQRPPINTGGAGGEIVPIPIDINVKGGAGKNISSLVVGKLSTLNSSMSNSGINWRVTEGHPPTRTHRSPCHQNGTCVDANFTGQTQATPANITTFINNANSAGLVAVYEVSSNAEKVALISQGVPSSNIISYSGITAPHFSVYNR